MKTTTRRIAIAALLVAGSASPARAQPFDAVWVPLECEDQPMTDLANDESGAVDERDIVGDVDNPAGFRAADGTFAYFRLRLDATPTEDTGALRPFAWGLELDLDGDYTTYEILIMASGLSQEVLLYSNDTTTLPNDPNDPADDPPVAVYTWASAGQSVEADSSFDGDADAFLDIAIPWDDLEPLGVGRVSEVGVWAASSSSDTSLDADFACHDGSTGDPDLDDIVSDDTVVDPDADSDGDGFSDADEIDAGSDPDDPDSVPDGGGTGETDLEGGGGCAAGSNGSEPWPALLLLAAALAWIRRRCS